MNGRPWLRLTILRQGSATAGSLIGFASCCHSTRVSQNKTYSHEVSGGYLWSPKRKAHQAANPFYDFMREVSPGDVIFSFSETLIRAIGIASSHAYEAPKPLEFKQTGAYWDKIGWRVDIRFHELRMPIRPSHHMDVLTKFLPKRYAPLQASGAGPQLDGENGLLLTPSIDHLFDRGFIGFEDDGQVIVSPVVHRESLLRMGIKPGSLPKTGNFSSGQRLFLTYHRENVLLRSSFLDKV